MVFCLQPHLIPFLGLCQSCSICIDGFVPTHLSFFSNNWRKPLRILHHFSVFSVDAWFFFSRCSPSFLYLKKKNVPHSSFYFYLVRWHFPLSPISIIAVITFYYNNLLSLCHPTVSIFQILRAENIHLCFISFDSLPSTYRCSKFIHSVN